MIRKALRSELSSSPTLSLMTRKFARQSHAVFSESRNAVFYRLRRSVRLGSIPIARSIFGRLALVSCWAKDGLPLSKMHFADPKTLILNSWGLRNARQS